MDLRAARRARREAIQADLSQVYSDEEACPPEWLDLLTQIREESVAIQDEISRETRRFVDEPDIKGALERRTRVGTQLRERIAVLNTKVRRLNLIAPHQRFTRASLNADEILRPLYRSARNLGS
ncbi:MAG TPA: hypothetical protein VFA34_02785 [Actinomycetota bacterium]|jgi:hypothetical protein|nr:hypothetical protein [Actinomycetota bacterium]